MHHLVVFHPDAVSFSHPDVASWEIKDDRLTAESVGVAATL